MTRKIPLAFVEGFFVGQNFSKKIGRKTSLTYLTYGLGLSVTGGAARPQRQC